MFSDLNSDENIAEIMGWISAFSGLEPALSVYIQPDSVQSPAFCVFRSLSVSKLVNRKLFVVVE